MNRREREKFKISHLLIDNQNGTNLEKKEEKKQIWDKIDFTI